MLIDTFKHHIKCYNYTYIIQNKRPMGHIAPLIDSSQVNFQKILKIKVYV